MRRTLKLCCGLTLAAAFPPFLAAQQFLLELPPGTTTDDAGVIHEYADRNGDGRPDLYVVGGTSQGVRTDRIHCARTGRLLDTVQIDQAPHSEPTHNGLADMLVLPDGFDPLGSDGHAAVVVLSKGAGTDYIRVMSPGAVDSQGRATELFRFPAWAGSSTPTSPMEEYRNLKVIGDTNGDGIPELAMEVRDPLEVTTDRRGIAVIDLVPRARILRLGYSSTTALISAAFDGLHPTGTTLRDAVALPGGGFLAAVRQDPTGSAPWAVRRWDAAGNPVARIDVPDDATPGELAGPVADGSRSRVILKIRRPGASGDDAMGIDPVTMAYDYIPESSFPAGWSGNLVAAMTTDSRGLPIGWVTTSGLIWTYSNYRYPVPAFGIGPRLTEQLFAADGKRVTTGRILHAQQLDGTGQKELILAASPSALPPSRTSPSAWNLDSNAAFAELPGANPFIPDPAMRVFAGPQHAGHFFVVLGSSSGPGPFPLGGGVFLPSTPYTPAGLPDPYFEWSFYNGLFPGVTQGWAALDANGRGEALMNPVVLNFLRNYAGTLDLHHAVLILRPGGSLAAIEGPIALRF